MTYFAMTRAEGQKASSALAALASASCRRAARRQCRWPHPLAMPPTPVMAGDALLVTRPSVGALRLRAGRLELTVQVWLAAVPTLPARSIDRTWKVCEPLASPK